MADNVALPAVSGTVKTQDIGGFHYQEVIVTWGPDGVANTVDVASGKALPVQVRSATGLIPIGEPTDAKAAQTDATSVTLTSILKQLSHYLGLLLYGAGVEATALRVTLPTDGTGVVKLGAGTAEIGKLAAGTAGIGKLTANDGVDIGDVDVKSVTGIIPPAGEYETVAASQTAQALGATGATGDYIKHLIVIPATVSPGQVLLLDNATSITLFPGGTNSVLTLHPFIIPVEAFSVSGAWKVTTGANVSVMAVGNFT